MKKLLFPMALAMLSVSALQAQNPFDGTWKLDVKSFTFSGRPTTFLLKDGYFECSTCQPDPIKVKADGTDQPVTGDPYSDTLSVRIVDGRTVEEISKKKGKVVGKMTVVVSADGQSHIAEWTGYPENGAEPYHGKAQRTRISAGPDGSHPLSGSWKDSSIDSLSDNAATWTYKIVGDQISMTTLTGQSYTAKLDGTAAPVKGDPGTTDVQVKMIDDSTLEETSMRDGKITVVIRMKLGQNGKVLECDVDDRVQKDHYKSVAIRQ